MIIIIMNQAQTSSSSKKNENQPHTPQRKKITKTPSTQERKESLRMNGFYCIQGIERYVVRRLGELSLHLEFIPHEKRRPMDGW